MRVDGVKGYHDIAAADMLMERDDTLRAAGIDLCVGEMRDPVKDQFKRFGLHSRPGAERIFSTIGEAVSGYLTTHPVQWRDWEDRRR